MVSVTRLDLCSPLFCVQIFNAKNDSLENANTFVFALSIFTLKRNDVTQPRLHYYKGVNNKGMRFISSVIYSNWSHNSQYHKHFYLKREKNTNIVWKVLSMLYTPKSTESLKCFRNSISTDRRSSIFHWLSCHHQPLLGALRCSAGKPSSLHLAPTDWRSDMGCDRQAFPHHTTLLPGR